MSEGELKKKLFEAFVKAIQTEYNSVKYPNITTTYDATALTDVLNEAKKEFPKLKPIEITMISSILVNQTPEEMMKNVIERRESMQQQAEINAVKFIQEVQAWKEKWFSSE
jgi:hypothetical protein